MLFGDQGRKEKYAHIGEADFKFFKGKLGSIPRFKTE
jgi:hypothetical protein